MFMNAMMDAAAISMNNARERKNADEWMAYAQKLERDVRVCEGNAEGQRAIKDAALKELARLEPNNYLLIQENRTRIFDDAPAGTAVPLPPPTLCNKESERLMEIVDSGDRVAKASLRFLPYLQWRILCVIFSKK